MVTRMLAGVALVAATRAYAQTPRTPLDTPTKAELSASAVDVPLVKSGDFYFIDVQVNGRPSRFTLETGANFFAIGERLARSLGLRIDTITGPGGRAMAIADLSTLSFGGATLTGLRAQVTPMFNDPSFAGEGLISLPALRPFVATIDLRGRRLHLERGELPAPNGRDILPIAGRDPGGRVDVPITIGTTALSAVVDTRSFIGFTLPDSLASGISLVSPPRSIGEAAGPTLGIFQLQAARARETMQIGDVRVDRPVLTFRNRPGAVIGVPLLEQLILTLDQRHQRVRVVAADAGPITVGAQPWERAQTGERSSGGAQPAREGPPPPANSGQRTMGFNLAGVPGGALAVRNVIAGSSAEKVGLKEGDQLVEFDGTRPSDMNPTLFRAAAARGKPVRVVVERDGKRLELTIEPYVVP
jgi:aspartyl protease/PDZ domain-containing protein